MKNLSVVNLISSFKRDHKRHLERKQRFNEFRDFVTSYPEEFTTVKDVNSTMFDIETFGTVIRFQHQILPANKNDVVKIHKVTIGIEGKEVVTDPEIEIGFDQFGNINSLTGLELKEDCHSLNPEQGDIEYLLLCIISNVIFNQ